MFLIKENIMKRPVHIRKNFRTIL